MNIILSGKRDIYSDKLSYVSRLEIIRYIFRLLCILVCVVSLIFLCFFMLGVFLGLQKGYVFISLMYIIVCFNSIWIDIKWRNTIIVNKIIFLIGGVLTILILCVFE